MSRWRTYGNAAIEMVFLFPFIVIIAAYAVEPPMLKAWLPWLPLYGWIGIRVAHWRWLRLRWLRWLVSMLAGIGIGYVLFSMCAWMIGITPSGLSFWIPWITYSVVGTPLIVRGMTLRSKRWEDALPFGPIWLSLLIYIPACSILPKFETFAPYQAWFIVLGGIALLVGLLTANSLQLRTESRAGNRQFRLSASMLIQNRLLVIGLLVAAMVLAGIRVVIDAGIWIVRMVVWFIAAIMDFLASIITFTTVPQKGPEASAPAALPGGEASPIAKFLEIAIQIFAAILLIAAAGYILYRYVPVWFRLIGKLLLRLVRYLMDRGASSEQQAGYTDETTSLWEWKQVRNEYLDRLKSWIPSAKDRLAGWEELESNTEKARFLFQRAVRERVHKGFPLQAHLTPAEMLALSKTSADAADTSDRELVNLYQKARYTDASLDDQGDQLDQLKRSLEQRKHNTPT
jgi:hypothetical protein